MYQYIQQIKSYFDFDFTKIGFSSPSKDIVPFVVSLNYFSSLQLFGFLLLHFLQVFFVLLDISLDHRQKMFFMLGVEALKVFTVFLKIVGGDKSVKLKDLVEEDVLKLVEMLEGNPSANSIILIHSIMIIIHFSGNGQADGEHLVDVLPSQSKALPVGYSIQEDQQDDEIGFRTVERQDQSYFNIVLLWMYPSILSASLPFELKHSKVDSVLFCRLMLSSRMQWSRCFRWNGL